jgi:predicted 3-demethylubiquinone-9 3-methyltransferase (glyoxalase superfamily)
MAPGDFPGGKEDDVLTVEFIILGIPCLGLNGGPTFKHSEAFSFQIATDDQEETDRYWTAIVSNGGQESECGWCKDRWGLSWQITPRVLTEALAKGGSEAKRAFEAMMSMKKINIAAIVASRPRERSERHQRSENGLPPLVSGGQTTVANLFYKMARRVVGLVGVSASETSRTSRPTSTG